TNESDNAVSVIDARTLKVVRSVPVGKRPRDIAFAHDSSFAFVSGELDASLYRLGLQGEEPAKRVLQLRQEALPMALVLDASRHRLYMSTGRGGTVAVIDVKNDPQLLAEVPVGTRPWGIALSADGSRLYAANGPFIYVGIADTKTLRAI